jgi:hypothetical protein
LAQSDSGSLVPTPGEYVWRVAGKPVAVHLNLDVVDRMLQEVVRGFAAVPRRGAEVGGILLGSAEQQQDLIVHVDDFEPVPIEYKRGPSYQLSEADEVAFGEALQRLRARTAIRPVGFFRSHTRDGVGLSGEDLEHLKRYFPEPDAIALLIRPFATKTSTAGFYFRENGAFAAGPALLEFPFRRKELDPAAKSGKARGGLERLDPPLPAPVRKEPIPMPQRPSVEDRSREAERKPDGTVSGFLGEPASTRQWTWAPLAFICLLAGLLLGFLVALNMRPQSIGALSDTFHLSMSITKSGDNLHVKWDRQAAAIRASQRGVLTIDDGTFTKRLDLDSSQLQNGSVVYGHASGNVRFQLQVFPSARDVLTETVEWKE